MVDNDTITNFDGDDGNEFLSNFFPSKTCPPTVEHHFAAAKTLDPLWRGAILNAVTPGKAKMLGRSAPLRPDWEDIKNTVMRQCLKEKFQDPELRKRLLATGDAKLIEGNTWGDRVWGMTWNEKRAEWVGENRLGFMLMELREQLRNETK